jgi:hypothetical protein
VGNHQQAKRKILHPDGTKKRNKAILIYLQVRELFLKKSACKQDTGI